MGGVTTYYVGNYYERTSSGAEKKYYYLNRFIWKTNEGKLCAT